MSDDECSGGTGKWRRQQLSVANTIHLAHRIHEYILLADRGEVAFESDSSFRRANVLGVSFMIRFSAPLPDPILEFRD